MKVDAYDVTASFEKVVLMTMMYLCFGVQFLLIENGVVDLRCYPFSSWSRQQVRGGEQRPHECYS